MENDKSMEGSVTHLKLEGVETIHQVWSTPIVMARPFDDKFLAKLREDVKYLLKDRNSPGNLNQTNLWALPDLPETMLAVKAKKLELAERAFRIDCEMPLPPFIARKGYFRVTYPESPYRIMPHDHGNVYGVGIFYINITPRNPGYLTFIDPRGGVQWTNQFTKFKKVRVEEGLMVLHPGYLIHFVEPADAKMGMYYGERLALVTNIHRDPDEWYTILKEQDELIRKMGGTDV
jgi:hypothetical protein